MKKLLLCFFLFGLSFSLFAQTYTFSKSDYSGFFKMNDNVYQQYQFITKLVNQGDTTYRITISSKNPPYFNLINNQLISTIAGGSTLDSIMTILSDYSVSYDNEISLKDQVTTSINVPFVNVAGTTTLSEATTANLYYFLVTDNSSMTTGDNIRIITSDNFYVGNIISTNGDTVFTTAPVNAVFASGSEVTFGSSEMAVDATGQQYIFNVRTADSTYNSAIDITRLIFSMQTSSSINLNYFGDISGGLTYGVTVRKKTDSGYENLLTINTNFDLAGMAFDFQPYDASNQGQAVNGFVSRLTYAGQNKFGVAIRLETWEDLQVVIYGDDLSSLTSFTIRAQGHVTNLVSHESY